MTLIRETTSCLRVYGSFSRRLTYTIFFPFFIFTMAITLKGCLLQGDMRDFSLFFHENSISIVVFHTFCTASYRNTRCCYPDESFLSAEYYFQIHPSLILIDREKKKQHNHRWVNPCKAPTPKPNHQSC